MRGYGLPRRAFISNPDLYQITYYGLQSSAASNFKTSYKNSQAKRDTRRIWKKKERAANVRDLRQRIREAIE